MQNMKFSGQLTNFENSVLINALQDIAQNVQIKSDFCIEHPNYKPFELPVEVVRRLQELPIETKNRYLNQQLQSFLYGIYYNGSLIEKLLFDANTNTSTLKRDLENNTFSGIDPEFYQQLHTSNNGKGYFDSGWQVLGIDSGDGSLIVKKDGLTLHIESNSSDEDKFASLACGSWISIRLPKNRIQNGFYAAVGNAGLSNPNNQNDNRNIVRIYFNVTDESAPKIVNSLTKQLNEASIPFSFKTLYNPADYSKRCDCAVLYFGKENYHVVKQVLQSIYLEHQACFPNKVPLFTKILAPGLALAEEPNHKFSAKESFGTHRCQIVANGLLEAWQKGDNSPENRMMCISQHFSQLGIDLERPYLNADSEDVYTPLDL